VSTIVDLDNELNRLPRNLSGGQRQRVALGRSIVRAAKVFLMDEPLSNLDAKLRAQTRREIILLHHRLKPTIIYVTHDQIEAMTMATRIVVMNNGVIQQIGSPYDVYQCPCNLFVAGFIGSPAMNFILGTIDDDHLFTSGSFRMRLTDKEANQLAGRKQVIMGIRPEQFLICPEPSHASTRRDILATIHYSELLGASATLHFTLNDREMIASVDSEHYRNANEEVLLYISTQQIHFFDPDTEQAIQVAS
jgi:multiple sugar transport system ATP-binding protein